MNITLNFGKEKKIIDIPDINLLQILTPNEYETGLINEDEIEWALDNPIESQSIEELFSAEDKIAIVTSDITRPVPNKLILPQLLCRLVLAGVKTENITIVFALGSHRNHSEAEMINLVGPDIYDTYRCVDSGSNGFVNMGISSYGTPLEICKHVAEAQKRICVGNIEFHYFAGYSGGAKAIMPGVSTRVAIQANHKRMVEAAAHAGNIMDNPVRLDIDEVLRYCPVDFILNVVLSEKKEIIKAVAGNCVKAHLAGCEFLDAIYKISIEEKADIVLVSAGGWPKDINVYQAQKALDNAKHAVCDGGTIILLASCKEGLGEEVFEEWLLQAQCPGDLIFRIKREFVLGGHKAAAIALVLEKNEIFLVSDLKPELVEALFMKPYNDLDFAFDVALAKHGEAAKVIVMPFGGSTLPRLQVD
ncbi:MAG: nickel-dependent lactate racemase [Negativicutes bacterium]|jgi:nickel-dependent lactate racemase